MSLRSCLCDGAVLLVTQPSRAESTYYSNHAVTETTATQRVSSEPHLTLGFVGLSPSSPPSREKPLEPHIKHTQACLWRISVIQVMEVSPLISPSVTGFSVSPLVTSRSACLRAKVRRTSCKHRGASQTPPWRHRAGNGVFASHGRQVLARGVVWRVAPRFGAV